MPCNNDGQNMGNYIHMLISCYTGRFGLPNNWNWSNRSKFLLVILVYFVFYKSEFSEFGDTVNAILHSNNLMLYPQKTSRRGLGLGGLLRDNGLACAKFFLRKMQTRCPHPILI